MSFVHFSVVVSCLILNVAGCVVRLFVLLFGIYIYIYVLCMFVVSWCRPVHVGCGAMQISSGVMLCMVRVMQYSNNVILKQCC